MDQPQNQQKAQQPKGQPHRQPWKPKHHKHQDGRNVLILALLTLMGVMFICVTYFMSSVVKLNTRSHSNLHTVAVLNECGAPKWVVVMVDGSPVIASWTELTSSRLLSREYKTAYRVVQRNIGCGDHHGK